MAERPNAAQPGDRSADEIQRRDFLTMAAGAAALSLSNGSPAFAAESEELAALTMAEASRQIHSRKITCTQLTQACIERSKVYNAKVNAYITLMQEGALQQAAQLDAEAAAGKFRGPPARHSDRSKRQYRHRRNPHHRR